MREVEVHISASSTCMRNSTRKLQLFALPAQRSAQDLITTMLLIKVVETCVCYFSGCEMKELIMHTENV